jgi:membrane protein
MAKTDRGSRAETDDVEHRPPPDDPRKPDSPTDLPKRSWWGVAKRAVLESKSDNITDWAAALTYYGVLSLFPALIVFLALLSLVGQDKNVIQAMTDIVNSLGAPGAADTLRKWVQSVVAGRSAAGGLLTFGLLGAIWSASGYIGALIRAMNAIYEVREGRKFYVLRPLQLVVTVVGVLLVSLIALSFVITGPVAKAIGDAVGLGDTAVTVWNIAKWPVILVIVALMIAALYHIAPNVKQPRFRWFTLGGALAVFLWIAASAGFAIYVAKFGSYNKTYGALGGVIVFLVWLWITNLVVLFGAEVNAEAERGRELEAGLPADDEIQLPHRRVPR